MNGSIYRSTVWTVFLHLNIPGRSWWDFFDEMDTLLMHDRRALWKESGFQDVDSSEDLEID